MALQTRLIPVANGLRLPVLTELEDTHKVYDWLASWSLGPRDTTWRFNNPLQDANVGDLKTGTWYSLSLGRNDFEPGLIKPYKNRTFKYLPKR